MDRKIGRTQIKLESVKDRGDLRKTATKENTETDTKELSDRGDTLQKSKINYKLVKKSSYVIVEHKSSVKTSDKEEDSKRDQTTIKEPVKKVSDKTERFENQIKTYLDLDGRRRLRERYTLKIKNQKDLVKIEKEKGSDKDEKKSDGEHSKSNNSDKSVKLEKRKETPKRRPIIKTITIKNDNKVYKAVTFVDQKNHTPLQIKIPSSLKKKVSKSTETNFKIQTPSVNVPLNPLPVPSKTSIKEKTVKKEKKRKRVISPDVIHPNTDNRSPATEVAKWAPSSTNNHTKPYYEAWVSTTLTSVSKCTDAEKEELYRTFQRRRPITPELFYENFQDERFAGRIKVKTK